MIAAVALAACVAWAAAAPSPRVAPYWLQTYTPPYYAEIWTAEILVKSLDQDVPKVLAAIEKNGGSLTQSFDSFAGSAEGGQQQLSFSIQRSSQERLLKALRRAGRVKPPVSRPQGGALPRDEIRGKLARLSKDKSEKGAALARVPSAAEVVDELIEQLSTVEAAAQEAEKRALWNLTIRVRR